MKRRITGLLIIVGLSMFLCACAIGNSIQGKYIGEEGGGNLEINGGSWTYHEEGWIETLDFSGTVEKMDNNTYRLDCDKITMYADKEEDRVYLYSDDQRWKAEWFRKVSSN